MAIIIDLRVADCMTRNVVTVGRNDSLTRAIGIMDQKRLSVLPVIDHTGCMCGILSDSDLVRIAYDLQCDVCVLPHVSPCVRKTLIDALAEDNQALVVASTMSDHVVTIKESAGIADAAARMIEHSIHHLPVVDDSNNLAGIIATTDIVRAVAAAKGSTVADDNDIQNPGRGDNNGGQDIGDDDKWLPIANGKSNRKQRRPGKL